MHLNTYICFCETTATVKIMKIMNISITSKGFLVISCNPCLPNPTPGLRQTFAVIIDKFVFSRLLGK